MAADHDGSKPGATDADLGMAQTRPASDPVAMERARAQIERALFGHARPARLGRYQILDPIAGGGMGLVYAAHDPELDRKVALKVLHPSRDHDARARERLLEEARALARLDHPNVVKVYDVLAADGQIVVVMALLAGETLGSWEQRARRPWRQIVAAYAHAGRGLAAAHSVGVIHGDFKPSNAMIGDDGEVRVLDFGLARLSAGTNDDPSEPGGARGSLSGRNGFVGTLAYAAPEQLSGEVVTAESDQFSLCVALHRAVEGTPPFTGDSVEELAASIYRDPIRVARDGRRVPVWLRRVLRRGLSFDPARRHPSVRALIGELERARGWLRWRWPVSSSVLIGAAIAGTAVISGGSPPPACDGGVARTAAVWGPVERIRLLAALDGTASPLAGDVAGRVIDGLDERVRDWSVVHRDVCVAHRSGTTSDGLLDREMRCLDRQLGAIQSAIAVVEQTRGEALSRATGVIAGLAPSHWCDAPERLAEDVHPPANTAVDAEVRGIRAQLSTAAALDRAGRSDEARELARSAAATAHATGYPAAIAEAELERGRIAIGRSDLVEATAVLTIARDAALRTNQTRLAVEAGARLVFAEGTNGADLRRIEDDLAVFEPLSASLADDTFVGPLLLGNAGAVYFTARQPERARQYLERAHQALRGQVPDVELTSIDIALATMTADPGERVALAERAWRRIRDVLGPHHPRALYARAMLAGFQSSPDAAERLIAPVCDEYVRYHAALVSDVIDCELVRAYVARAAGHVAAADEAYAIVIHDVATPDGEPYADDGRIATAELAFDRGDLAAAKTLFAAELASARTQPWWIRQLAWESELGLGRIAMAQRDPSAALAHFQAAAAGYTDIAATNPAIIYSGRAADATALASEILRRPERDGHGAH